MWNVETRGNPLDGRDAGHIGVRSLIAYLVVHTCPRRLGLSHPDVWHGMSSIHTKLSSRITLLGRVTEAAPCTTVWELNPTSPILPLPTKCEGRMTRGEIVHSNATVGVNSQP